jgi:hypothetical protein
LPGTDYGEYPSWSPDGTRIAFNSNLSGEGLTYIVDVDGSRVVDLWRVGQGHEVASLHRYPMDWTILAECDPATRQEAAGQAAGDLPAVLPCQALCRQTKILLQARPDRLCEVHMTWSRSLRAFLIIGLTVGLTQLGLRSRFEPARAAAGDAVEGRSALRYPCTNAASDTGSA